MSVAKSLVVLAPNGRRQTVNVTPDTTILQVLETVCNKQGFRTEEYDIKHHNRIVDPTSVMRFSGLPNNAQLEMAPAVKQRRESEVCVGLQLESGQRLAGNFMPSDSIWDVLQMLCPDQVEVGSNPVVIYMRAEVAGLSKLRETTLRTLGITAGRVMLRLIHRTTEELQHQANVSAPLQRRSVETVTKQPTLKRACPTEQVEIDSSSFDEATSLRRETTAHSSVPEVSNPLIWNSELKKEVSSKIPTNSIVTESQITAKDNFKVEAKEQTLHTKKHSQKAPFQESMTEELPVDDIVFLGERNAVAYNMATAKSANFYDLPDEFFELTVEDARVLLRDIRKQREELENAPMTTAAMREMERSSRALNDLKRYKKSVIRIKFPDQLVLQGTFTPTETVSAISQFIKHFLEDPNMPFYLFTAPPKEVLSEESHLVEVGLVPSAVIHFGSKIAPSEGVTYLRRDILDRLTTPSVAALAASQDRCLPTVAVPPTSTSSEPSPGPSGIQQDADMLPKASLRSTSITETHSNKVPKWFKPVK